MSNSGRPSVDHKLPHRIEDWARSTGSTPLERDADAIVAWLRGQRGSEYARKPADGLRRQVVRAIERMRSEAARGGAEESGANGHAAARGAKRPGTPTLKKVESGRGSTPPIFSRILSCVNHLMATSK